MKSFYVKFLSLKIKNNDYFKILFFYYLKKYNIDLLFLNKINLHYTDNAFLLLLRI